MPTIRNDLMTDNALHDIASTVQRDVASASPRDDLGAAGVLLWNGMKVRTRDGTELGIVVGAFEEGPCKGRLRVHGDAGQFPRRHMTGTAVFAIPRGAVARRTERSVILNDTATSARHRWFMHVIQK